MREIAVQDIPSREDAVVVPHDLGRLERYEAFPSAHVPPRHVDVWLPDGYHAAGTSYPVIYAHDGQNLFRPSEAFGGIDWGLDEAVHQLSREEIIPEVIVVGIWNTSNRIPEYMPQKPFEANGFEKEHAAVTERFGNPPSSDRYLQFIVDELKPIIDATYRTRMGKEDTLIMGSSMGGLLSLYAFCEYPDVFGMAGCLSTSMTVIGEPLIAFLKARNVSDKDRRIYMDYGIEWDLPAYRALHQRVVQAWQDNGFAKERDLQVKFYSGQPHAESAWRSRVHVPLKFLLNSRRV